jgi:DNA-binding response OmpR family regulator
VEGDAALLDLGLPDLSGQEALARPRGEQDRGPRRGAYGDMGKPFGVGELLARIRTVLRHRT